MKHIKLYEQQILPQDFSWSDPKFLKSLESTEKQTEFLEIFARKRDVISIKRLVLLIVKILPYMDDRSKMDFVLNFSMILHKYDLFDALDNHLDQFPVKSNMFFDRQ
jgi:hypothetical protein